ncbi:asparagine synthase-related protein [uncultured Roseobacter sp.]|uniref:asparagine synthase-related protein n=1 Tax=uncultured Roseobacter sp. TaxID=114847 RepID=UPI00260AF705|nr:asparagine synthase-related protein [uncultured Roseobacter sp.]
MTHAYAVRLPLSGAAPVSSPTDAARLSRMTAAGWEVDQPGADMDVAIHGSAGCHRSGNWLVCGIAFLTDRPAVLAQLGSTSDTAARDDLALLLDLRMAVGERFAADVAGAFSVVFVDLERGAAEGYRDRLGLYPFYHVIKGGALTCGSDMRACLHLSAVPLAPDPVRIADFVQGEEVDVLSTAFDALRRLPPCHRLVSAQEGPDVEPYWSLTQPEPQPEAGAAAELRHRLQQSTAACLRADGRVGAMLSGGLDSSALAGLAAAEASEPLPTLSFVYGDDKAYDETPFIDAANDAFGSEPHKIPLGAAPPLSALGPVIEEQMDLFLAPGLPKSRQIYAEARKLGLAALIDGHGGDEVISHGYGRLVELAAARRFVTLWREARGASQIHGVPLIGVYLSHIARYSGMRPGHPVRRVLMKLARISQNRASLAGWRDGAASLVAPALREGLDARRYKTDPPLNTRADFQRAEQIMHMAAVTDPLMTQSFEVLHRSATAQGILPRYPFFDWGVLSFSLALPSHLKLKDGRSRWILRDAMAGVLPDRIRLRRDKAEFGNELKDVVLSYYRDKDARAFAPLADLVDAQAAERLRARVISGKVTDVAAIRALWRLAVLIHWTQAHARWQDAQDKGTLI